MAENKTKRNARQVQRIDSSFGKYSPEVVARPVDTYIHHQAQDAGRNYQMLAASLSGIAPAINQFLNGKHDEQVAKDEAKGQRFYYEQGEPLSWADVREKQDARLREIGVNTSVRNGYLKARMANEANIFREEMYNAYNSGEDKVTLPDGTEVPVAESDDPNVFNLWLNRFTSQYIKDNLGKDADPEYFAKIFVPQLEKNVNEIQSIHIHERNRVLSDRVISESNTRISNAIARLVTKEGTLSDSPDERKEALDEIQSTLQNMRVSGLSHAQIDESLTNLLLSMAMDPSTGFGEDFLYLAREIRMENGKSLWDTGTNALKFIRAIPEIQQRRDWREIREKRQREERASLAAADVMDYVYNGKLIPPEVQQEFQAVYGQDALIKLLHNAETVRRYNFPEVTTSAGKVRQQQANALISYVQTAIAKGETVDLMSLVDTEEWNALTVAEQAKIISMVKSTTESKAIIQQANKHLDAVASEFLEGKGLGKGKSMNYERYYMALTGALRSHIQNAAKTPEVIANPEAFYQEITREAYSFMQQVMDKPGLLQAIKDKQLPPSDFGTAAKVIAAEREEKIRQRLAQAQKENKPVDSLLYRHLMTRSEKKTQSGSGQHLGQLFVGMSPKKEKGQLYGAPRDEGKRTHKGIDLSVPVGTKLIVPKGVDCSLTVKDIQAKNVGNGGKYVVLTGKRPNNDDVEVTLMHLHSINVKKGQTLNPGDLIALSGNTGVGTGPHLHIQLKVNKKLVDPEKYLFS